MIEVKSSFNKTPSIDGFVNPSHRKLTAIFAFATTSLALYGFVSHRVDVTVNSKGVTAGSHGVAGRYLITDHGVADIKMQDTSQFLVGASQRASCKWSLGWTLHCRLRDCVPR